MQKISIQEDRITRLEIDPKNHNQSLKVCDQSIRIHYVTFAWKLIKRYGFYSKVIKKLPIYPKTFTLICYFDDNKK